MFRRTCFALSVLAGLIASAFAAGAEPVPAAPDSVRIQNEIDLLARQRFWLDSLARAERAVAESESNLRRAKMHKQATRDSDREEAYRRDTASGEVNQRTRPHESFIQAALIRTITSNSEDKEATSREFLDVRLRLVGGARVFTLANVDADMLAGEKRDSTTLRDASFSINYTPWFSTQYETARTTFVGGLFRIFDGVSYYGLQVGGQELHKSTLAPSVITGAVVWPLTTTFEQTFHKHNGQPSGLLLDFYVCDSDSTSFLNKLNLRGSILFDLEHAQSPNYRFVVEVPFARYRSLP